MRILGVIIARGGSKRLPGKNVRPLGGHPLIAWSVKAAAASRLLDRCVVSTDDSDIAAAAWAAGGDVPFLRPRALAADDVSPVSVLQHAAAAMDDAGFVSDAILLLQATSPFRSGKRIDEAITTFRESGADTLTAVMPAPAHPYWIWRKIGGRLEPFFNRELMQADRSQLPDAFIETGAFFAIRRAVIDSGSLYGDVVVPFSVDASEAHDIDTIEDFAAAEALVVSGAASLP